MIRNYLLLAFRNLKKRKLYSFINILGLAIGAAVCLVILKYVDFELSYDSFHKNAPNIYRSLNVYYNSSGEVVASDPLSGYKQGPTLMAELPEVKAYVRTHPMYSGAVVSNEDHPGGPVRFHESNLQFVDSTFLDVFTYHLLAGDMATALDHPSSMVITNKTAEKYFGKGVDAIGKTLKITGGQSNGDYTVTGVIDEVPQNGHFNFDFLLSIHNLLLTRQYTEDDGWGWLNFVTYYQLHDGTNLEAFNQKIPALIDKYRGEDLAASGTILGWEFQPIRSIHLRTGLNNESSATTNINTIYFFIIIAIFVLAIAWVNYINLSTARAMERAREVGVKKAIGAFKSQLIGQFIFESILVNLLGVVLAVLLAMSLLPVVGQIVEKEFVFDFQDIRLWIALTVLFVTGSLISGAYPAFVLSSFKPVTVLKGHADKMAGGFSLRKVLVVFQFSASLILIAMTFAVYRQINYMQSTDKGLNMEQMLVINGPSVVEGDFTERITSFKNELHTLPSVVNAASSNSIPGAGYNWGTGIRKEGTERDAEKYGSIVWVDPDFTKTYEVELIAGKAWSPESKADLERVLINEAAVTTFGLGDAESAVQEKLILGGGDTVSILGVLKNYHWNSLKSEHGPFILAATQVGRRYFSVHLSGGSMQEAIRQIEDQYKASFPGNPFEYFFLDDFFNDQYKADQQFGTIFSLFAILAILIACMGLWGLASFTITQKLREISIRKVMGASMSNIMSLLSGQFILLVLISSVIALPLAWYGVTTWLDTFAFKVGLQWDLFVVPVVILAFISLGTVSFQILRGANTNPANVLRSE